MDTDDSQGAGRSADDETADKNEQPRMEKTENVEEPKLKYKYPTSTMPGGPLQFRKRLQKGQLYFDSGDYYMAKEKSQKAVLQMGPSVPTILQSPTGKIIPTVESLPPRKNSQVQSKLASELSSDNSSSAEEEPSAHSQLA
nr:cAMP-regulated phosphoprotein 19-like isoform X1 [Rhipicephalus microplus]